MKRPNARCRAGFNPTGLLLVMLLVMLLAPVAAASEPTPDKILAKADTARGNVEGVQWIIDIDSVEKGRTQHRVLEVKARNFDSLAEFLSPAKVKGRKLLMRDRNMWFMKPGLRKPVPISPRQKLLGGASNGDIASTNYAGDYEVTEASNDTVNGEACHLFDLRATNKSATYDRIVYWISKSRLVGVKADFYTVSGKRFKSATFEYENRITVGDESQPFISRMVITHALMKDDVTVMTYRDARVGHIPDSTFNLNLLAR